MLAISRYYIWFLSSNWRNWKSQCGFETIIVYFVVLWWVVIWQAGKEALAFASISSLSMSTISFMTEKEGLMLFSVKGSLKLWTPAFIFSEWFTEEIGWEIYTVSKNVPTFKLSVAMWNLNRFSKILHCWKAYEICLLQNPYNVTHLTLGMLLHYLCMVL